MFGLTSPTLLPNIGADYQSNISWKNVLTYTITKVTKKVNIITDI